MLAGGCYHRQERTMCNGISHWGCVRLQVDATIAKSVQRVTGSVIGAMYAFLVMLRPVVATNPYAVATMVCFSAFMCGLLVEHRFRYGSFLALYTSAVVMLAQVWFRQRGVFGQLLHQLLHDSCMSVSCWAMLGLFVAALPAAAHPTGLRACCSKRGGGMMRNKPSSHLAHLQGSGFRSRDCDNVMHNKPAS